MSLSSGYYSTFNRDTNKQDTSGNYSFLTFKHEHLLHFSQNSVIQEEADDTSEYNTEASMKTAHPHLPPLDSFAIDCEIKGSNNSNWYLLKKFGLDQEEKFSEYQPSNQRNRTQHNVYHLKTEGIDRSDRIDEVKLLIFFILFQDLLENTEKFPEA